jgi:hypothetical protein
LSANIHKKIFLQRPRPESFCKSFATMKAPVDSACKSFATGSDYYAIRAAKNRLKTFGEPFKTTNIAILISEPNAAKRKNHIGQLQ